MSRQFWSETLAWSTASGTAIATSSTETVLIPNVTIPANLMQDGRCLRLYLTGGYGTTTTGPTVQFRIRWGGVSGTVLAATGAYTLSNSAGGGASMTALWTLKAVIQVRSNGSSGSLFTQGETILYTTGTAAGVDLAMCSGSTGGTTPVAVTADLTADTALSVTAQFGTSNAANSIQAHTFQLEALN